VSFENLIVTQGRVSFSPFVRILPDYPLVYSNIQLIVPRTVRQANQAPEKLMHHQASENRNRSRQISREIVTEIKRCYYTKRAALLGKRGIRGQGNNQMASAMARMRREHENSKENAKLW